jgi:hypothetical protein
MRTRSAPFRCRPGRRGGGVKRCDLAARPARPGRRHRAHPRCDRSRDAGASTEPMVSSDKPPAHKRSRASRPGRAVGSRLKQQRRRGRQRDRSRACSSRTSIQRTAASIGRIDWRWTHACFWRFARL